MKIYKSIATDKRNYAAVHSKLFECPREAMRWAQDTGGKIWDKLVSDYKRRRPDSVDEEEVREHLTSLVMRVEELEIKKRQDLIELLEGNEEDFSRIVCTSECVGKWHHPA